MISSIRVPIAKSYTGPLKDGQVYRSKDGSQIEIYDIRKDEKGMWVALVKFLSKTSQPFVMFSCYDIEQEIANRKWIRMKSSPHSEPPASTPTTD